MPVPPETPNTGKPETRGGAYPWLGLIVLVALAAIVVGAFGMIWFDGGPWLRILLSGCVAMAFAFVVVLIAQAD